MEEKKYSTVIFDLDGTLLDTLDDLYVSVNASLKKNGFPEREKSEIRFFLGNGLLRLIRQSVPEGTGAEKVNQVCEDFREYYLRHCEDRTGPFGGMMELLENLKKENIQMAIVSNKPDPAVKELAKKYFDGILPVAIGEREGVKRKPEPDSVFEAMRILQAERKSTIYVGDSEVDYETAKNAGVPCILVTWGFRDEEKLRALEPDFLVHQPGEILEIVAGGSGLGIFSYYSEPMHPLGAFCCPEQRSCEQQP